VSPLRVAHLIAGLDPAAGGPPVVAARLAAAQRALGCEVSLISYDSGEGSARARELLAQTPGGDALDVRWIAPPSRAERLTGRAAAAAVAGRARAGLDILHTHGVWEPMMPASAAVARRLGVPYTIAPHGMLDPVVMSVARLKKRVALASTHRAFFAGAAFFHMLNEDEARLAGPLLRGRPTRVIPNGIFVEEFEDPPPADAFHADHPELKGERYVLFLGRLAHKKGLDYLADAFDILLRSVDGVRLVVAGPDGGQRAPFEAQVRRLGIGDRVHLVGPLYGHDKLAALRGAAVFCLPSRQEGFSIAITEALALGVPVVVSRACHYPEVTHAGAGVETELDPADVADALARVLADRAGAQAMGAAGHTLVRERFTWPSVARRSIECYREFTP